MKFGVVVFPGSNCDQDCVDVLKDVCKAPVAALWHEQSSLSGCDAIILPGGFSYGDYLRTGAVAHLAPIMRAVKQHAADGGLVLGICNGFQILLESGLLPGGILRNEGLKFICRFVNLRIERADTPFTNRFQPGQVVRMPIAHNEGRFTVEASKLDTIREQVVLRYCDAEGRVEPNANPNGSMDAVAGLVNERGNVMGLMPHPERAAEEALGSTDGRLFFESMLEVAHHV